MLNTRLKAAETVARELASLEDAIDNAVARAAALMEALPNARMDGGLAATVGQDAFVGAAKTLTTLVNARSDVVALHIMLSNIKDNMGLRTRAIGDGWKIAPAVQANGHMADTKICVE